MKTLENPLYSLISIEDFKSLMGVDEREDKIARFCLVTSTLTIEQHCKRRLLRKKHFERIEYMGDLLLPLKEYPVSKVLAVYAINSEQVTGNKEQRDYGDLIEPEFYEVVPDCGKREDWPYTLKLSPALKRYRGLSAVKVVYWAGYSKRSVPADLASACMELAAWNMNRYRGKRIGLTGNVRGGGKDGEHFEMSMPENVKALLEPYKRRVI
jgi:hypothetical protein